MGSPDGWGSLASPSFSRMETQDKVAGWDAGVCEHSLLHTLLCPETQLTEDHNHPVQPPPPGVQQKTSLGCIVHSSKLVLVSNPV